MGAGRATDGGVYMCLWAAADADADADAKETHGSFLMDREISP